MGGEVLLQLAHSGRVSKIKAVTRSSLKNISSNKTQNIVADFEGLEKYQEALKADVFICCLGTTIKKAGSQAAFRKVDYEYVLKFAKIAEAVKASKFLVVSAMGANPKSAVFYNRVKGEMEEALSQLDIPQVEIFRPSLLLGERKESRFGEGLAQKLNPIINVILSGPLKKYRAIEAVDVAKAICRCALTFKAGRFTYESNQIQEFAN